MAILLKECPWKCLIGLLAFLSLATSILAADPPSEKRSKKELPGADIFDATNVIRISVTVPSSGVRALNSRRGGGDDRPEARATVSDGTRTYTNVAVHLKGAAGSWRPFDDRPGLTLNFDKYAPGQSFHGLHKLSLNNSVQDPSFLSEKICRELFAAAGVPVPRSDFAVLTLNGKNLGLYVLVEGYNKQFLHRYFKDVSGNLYDCGFCQEISERMNINSGDQQNSHPGMRRLLSAVSSARQTRELDSLSKALDIDRFLTMTAMEVITLHWDGYAMNRNNYRVYHDKDTDRMVFMPHGMDQMFGRGGDHGKGGSTMFPPMQGVVAKTVLGTPEGRERYIKRFNELITNVFNAERLVSRVHQIEERLRPVLAEAGLRSPQQHRSQANRLCQNIEDRARAVASPSEGSMKLLEFDSNGYAKLDGWKGRVTSGEAEIQPSVTEDGKKALHISLNQGQAGASWRTYASLKPGQYRFEGMIKTMGIPREGQGGADLRLSGQRDSVRLITGNNNWMQVSCSFEIVEPVTQVVFVCELKGTQGEAWFDPASLHIRRLD